MPEITRAMKAGAQLLAVRSLTAWEKANVVDQRTCK